VLEHDANNLKALFRRGASHTKLGNFDQARADLRRAVSISPSDVDIRRELEHVKQKMEAYHEYNEQMSQRMFSGVGDIDEDHEMMGEGAANSANRQNDAGNAMDATADLSPSRANDALEWKQQTDETDRVAIENGGASGKREVVGSKGLFMVALLGASCVVAITYAFRLGSRVFLFAE